MSNVFKIARRVVVSLFGIPLLIIGIILIPVPGPGLLVSFVALIILSAEFVWARNHLKAVKIKIKEIYQQAKIRADKIEHLGGKKDERP